MRSAARRSCHTHVIIENVFVQEAWSSDGEEEFSDGEEEGDGGVCGERCGGAVSAPSGNNRARCPCVSRRTGTPTAPARLPTRRWDEEVAVTPPMRARRRCVH